MLVESKPWPSMPALDLEIHAPRLVTEQEIRVVGVSFGAEGDSLVIDALLCGAPRILFNVASMPLAAVSKESDGHPIVYGVNGMLSDGGIDEILTLPGLPDGPMALYRAGLVLGGDFRVQAQTHRVVDGIVYFSLHCRTQQGTLTDYAVASITVDLLRSRADGTLDIDILATSDAPPAKR
ncbi:MAG: hypothetical protein U5O16_14135 [Rhodococcus sp. (in: high G+C Gram-positive bacteria)]|uniref:hypothetical protein n=1 Tax=Rhodococcus sp. TaxID=1831 RepID=UPI002ADA70D8|nr:hypothetical protein [Rhodococcus sp. (in: high G+C Gram-positive bacteria)]